MSDIFISYAREDQQRAEMLAQILEGRGWSIFWDRTIPTGKTWRETIGSELDDAHCIIVLWSKISIKSGWVQDEADEAKRRGVLVPILIENVQPPMGFRSIQAAHLENWDGTESTQAFSRLIADIAALIGLPPKEGENEGRQVQAEIKRKAEEERKLAESQAKVETAVRRKVDEVAVARREAEKEKREPPFAPMSPAPRSATPELRQRSDRVASKQPKTAAMPWRIIAGGAIILGVIAIVAIWRPGLSVTPQPATPVTPQPASTLTTQDASAMYSEGERYYQAQDYAKAADWYEKAADKGNADAMFSLGVLYQNGWGVLPDYAKAREWYTKAADKGNIAAQVRLRQLPIVRQ